MLLGSVLNQALQPQEALHYLDQARTILKAAGNVSTLAKACQFISWVHYDQGRLQEALDAIEEAWEHAELTDSPRIQATVSLTFGMILFSAGIYAEAWKQIEIVLMKASYTGDRLGIARALEYMGYGYLRSGAYGAYDTAAEKYLGTDYAETGGERCKDNMARVEWKPGNSDTVVGFSRPRMDTDKNPFLFPCSSICGVNCPSPVLSYVLIPIARIFTYLIPRLFTLLCIIQYTKASKFVRTRDQTTRRT